MLSFNFLSLTFPTIEQKTFEKYYSKTIKRDNSRNKNVRSKNVPIMLNKRVIPAEPLLHYQKHLTPGWLTNLVVCHAKRRMETSCKQLDLLSQAATFV